MSASGYIAWAVTAGEVPTTAYWNILGANDASFNNGNGFNDHIITSRHLAANAVSNISYVYNEVAAMSSGAQSIGTTFTTGTNWGSGTLTTNGGTVVLHTNIIAYTPNAQLAKFRIAVNGTTYFPSSAGYTFFMNLTGTSYFIPHTIILNGLAAGTYTIAIQLAATSTTLTVDTSSMANVVAVEYLA